MNLSPKIWNLGVPAMLLVLAFTPLAQADPVITIHSTGDGVSPGNTDLYYNIVGTPSGPATLDPYVTSPGTSPTFPFQAWGTNGPNSKWISPQASYPSNAADAAGLWSFETTFDLSGYDHTTLNFTIAQFWADNQMTSISLNGFSIGFTPNVSPDVSNFPNPTSFLSALNSTFDTYGIAGTNTLTFVVNNYAGATGNPVGLQVNLAAEAAVVPEPGTWALVTVAGMGALFLRRRR